ncbi:MAG: ATPase, T2SS/T4P/T4SS family [Bdellovibrionota bacterium]
MSDSLKKSILAARPEWTLETGPLQGLLADPEVTEIMVNGPDTIFVERSGVIERSNIVFKSQDDLNKVAASIARTVGKEISRKFPYADVRLPDGSRANIIVAPVAVEGPVITIRKAQAQMLDLRNLVKANFFDEKVLYFLNVCVTARLNIIVSGGTGSGKTTLLNSLIGLIPQAERLVVIEDTLELVIRQQNVARLEARAESTYDEGIETKKLVRNALRMRPDRIIVGEARGGESWDIIQAMNSGHEGSMTAIHANSAAGALHKMEAFVLVEESGISSLLVRQHLADILNLVVQVERDVSGHRHISEIVELVGISNGLIETRTIFKRGDTGLKSCGIVPKFVAKLRPSVGLGFPANFFDPAKAIVLEGFSKE